MATPGYTAAAVVAHDNHYVGKSMRTRFHVNNDYLVRERSKAHICPRLDRLMQELLLRHVSDQRGTYLVERPARRWPVSVIKVIKHI